MEELEKKSTISDKDINRYEKKRVAMLEQYGIDEDDKITVARKNIFTWQNEFNDNIVRGKADASFLYRDQWSEIERNEFVRLFKPPLTFNKIYMEVKKIWSEQRKNKPDLMVRSLTGHASQEELDLRSDLLRTICYKSQNDLVYQQSFKDSTVLGFGAFEVGVDYENPTSFYKVLKLRSINDPYLCSFDPAALLPHKGDGNFCSRYYVYTDEEFRATHPYILNPVSFSDPGALVTLPMENNKYIVVCDYYEKEWFSEIIYKLSNGQSVTKSQWEEMQKTFKIQRELAESSQEVRDIILNEIPRIVAERQTQDFRIFHYRMLQNQIIDFTVLPIKQLPIIFVDGDSCYLEGRQYTRSYIGFAKDAQRFLNYTGSEIAAEIKNRRREQWIGTPDNILGNELMWRNPEQQVGILIAKPDPKTGQMPAKLPPWDLSPALMQNFQRAGQDIKEILGSSQAEEMGSRDISGKARRERNLEVSMSSYVYFDNHKQSAEQSARVMNEWLPYVYGDENRQITITKQDGKTKPFIINQQLPDGTIKNALTVGDFDVEISTGPSFAVQKDTALEFLQQTLAAFPQSFPLIADLYAKNLDVQFMPQIAERFQTMVPPEILAKENGTPPPPPKPNPEEMMMQQQMQMNHQKMQIEAAQLQERAEELQIRKSKHKLEELEMLMKAQELEEKLKSEGIGHGIELHKADLDYKKAIAKIVADLHVSKNQLKSDSPKHEIEQ